MDFELRVLNEDGTVKNRTDFLSEANQLYQELVDENESEKNFVLHLASETGGFEPDELFRRYHFLNRIIFLNKTIEKENSDGGIIDVGHEILEKIQFWNAQDEFENIPLEKRIPIKIYIDSPGGSLSTTFEIIDAIKNSKTAVHTIVTGEAFSGGFLIAIAGHKRYAFQNASLMLHEGSGGFFGDAHKVIQNMGYYESMLNRLKFHVINSTKITSENYDDHKKDDWYFSMRDALTLGIIDEVIVR